MIGHNFSGTYTSGFVQWEQDEIELGARVAHALADSEQWWWEIHRQQVEQDLASLEGDWWELYDKT